MRFTWSNEGTPAHARHLALVSAERLGLLFIHFACHAQRRVLVDVLRSAFMTL